MKILILVHLTLHVFGRGKQGHIKIKCPNSQNKEKFNDRKSKKESKTGITYITLKNNDWTSSSASSKEDEEVNLFLMVVYVYSGTIST